MITAVNIVFIILSLLVCIPIGMFCLEVALSLFPRIRRSLSGTSDIHPIAILIPAHNEELVLGRTLQTLGPTLGPSHRMLVVADNCTDKTAQIAAEHGAEVIERSSSAQRGKGYAVAFGLQHLAQQPPTAVVFLDADCQVERDTVRRLGDTALDTGRPVQGLYLCQAEGAGDPRQATSALAFRFKNLVRALGLSRLADVCHLTGSGMAIPWQLVKKIRLDGNVVEDMQWGIDLSLAGHAPLLLPEARLTSTLPSKQEAARTQRVRWEHGHLMTLLSQAPKLAIAAVRYQQWSLLCLALDLCIPPLALLMIIWLAVLLVACVGALAGASLLPPALLLSAGALLATATLGGWLVHCRREIPFQSLVSVPGYVLGKLPIYASFLWRRQSEWVRTDRDASPSPAGRGPG